MGVALSTKCGRESVVIKKLRLTHCATSHQSFPSLLRSRFNVHELERSSRGDWSTVNERHLQLFSFDDFLRTKAGLFGFCFARAGHVYTCMIHE